MNLLEISKYIVFILFIIFSFLPFHVNKIYFIILDILTILVLISIFLQSKTKKKLPIIIAVLFLIIANFLKDVKCGMCVGLGIGVILANLNY